MNELIEQITKLYDGQMDKECIELCNALNSIDGIETFESCCGHVKQPYRIWFKAETIQSLCIPTMACNKNYGGNAGWIIIVDHVESPNIRTVFLLEGTIGKEAYQASKEIAEQMVSFALVQQEEKQDYNCPVHGKLKGRTWCTQCWVQEEGKHNGQE